MSHRHVTMFVVESCGCDTKSYMLAVLSIVSKLNSAPSIRNVACEHSVWCMLRPEIGRRLGEGLVVQECFPAQYDRIVASEHVAHLR